MEFKNIIRASDSDSSFKLSAFSSKTVFLRFLTTAKVEFQQKIWKIIVCRQNSLQNILSVLSG